MRRQHFIWLILLLAGGLLLPVTPALADGDPPGDDGAVIWNEDYTLGKDEWLDGDLVVFNGDVTLETNSRVEGSAVIWNGRGTWSSLAGTSTWAIAPWCKGTSYAVGTVTSSRRREPAWMEASLRAYLSPIFPSSAGAISLGFQSRRHLHPLPESLAWNRCWPGYSGWCAMWSGYWWSPQWQDWWR